MTKSSTSNQSLTPLRLQQNITKLRILISGTFGLIIIGITGTVISPHSNVYRALFSISIGFLALEIWTLFRILNLYLKLTTQITTANASNWMRAFSHDIQNPLSIIRSGNDQESEFAPLIEQACIRISHQTKEVGELSQLLTLPILAGDIKKFFAEICEEINSARNSHRITLSVPHKPLSALYSSESLRHLLLGIYGKIINLSIQIAPQGFIEVSIQADANQEWRFTPFQMWELQLLMKHYGGFWEINFDKKYLKLFFLKSRPIIF